MFGGGGGVGGHTGIFVLIDPKYARRPDWNNYACILPGRKNVINTQKIVRVGKFLELAAFD